MGVAARRCGAGIVQPPQKPQDKAVRRTEKQIRRASKVGIRGPIRPIRPIPAAKDTAPVRKCLIAWPRQAKLRSNGTQFGEFRHTMIAVRLQELHRVLKPRGSLYLQCDPTASHYLTILLDAVFSFEPDRRHVCRQ